MTSLHVTFLTSIAELRSSAPAWDDLWQRSDLSLPTARAELVAQWIEQFAPEADFHALIVENNGRWLAALPLFGTRIRGFLTVGKLCGEPWIPSGALLLDSDADSMDVMNALVSSLRRLQWHLIWLKDVALDAPRWKSFLQATGQLEMNSDADDEWRLGRLDIDHDWDACQATWPAKHRYNMRRGARKLEAAGGRFVIYSGLDGYDVEHHIRRAFAIENRSWKGEAGSSMVKRRLLQYMIQQAQQLAKWKQLELACLEHKDNLVAFSYGCRSKRVHHTFKIGYDPESEFSYLSPGKLVWYFLIQHLWHDRDCDVLSFFGKTTESIRRWNPSTERIGRIIVAPRKFLGRTVLTAYKCFWKSPETSGIEEL